RQSTGRQPAMSTTKSLTRRVLGSTSARLGAAGGAVALGVTAAFVATAGASTASPAASTFSFRLVPSTGIAACLPHAGGRVTITTGRLNDTMKVSLHGMPRGSNFDLFVIQVPNKPFGVSWYQSDIHAGDRGRGSATVRGIFDAETFSVSLGA